MSSTGSPKGLGQRPGRMPFARWIGVVAVVALVVGTAVVTTLVRRGGSDAAPVSAVVPPHADNSVPGTPVNVGSSNCGGGWKGGSAGRQTFALWNNSTSGLEVYLEDAKTGAVYLDVESLGVAATRSASVVLGPGSYRFYCVPDDTTPAFGPTESVTGSYDGSDGPITPGLKIITANDLRPPLVRYEAWVKSRLPVLLRQVSALDADVRAGDLARAKADWLTGHRTYETLGAAYDAFGDYDADINGTPPTTTTALRDKQLEGFHKIEALLWSGAPAATIQHYTGALITAVRALQKAIASKGVQMNPLDIGLRSHEILENAIQFELTGSTDAGSHTNLATVDANLDGTQQALKYLLPLLRKADPALPQTLKSLARSRKLVASYGHDGSWKPLDSLTETQRARLNAQLDDTVELLSDIAVITDPRPAA